MQRHPGHTPVLLAETLRLLSPVGRAVIVDCTVGLGGHAQALLEAAGDEAVLVGLDVDESNLLITKQRLACYAPRVRLFQANFTELRAVFEDVGVVRVDAILADLGVSTSQLDDPERGFSFSATGPLDMRMDLRIETTAADLVNTLGEKELADLIYAYGQERYSRQIASAIVAARKRQRITTTTDLERIVFTAYPAVARRTRRGVHPATRTFQALRIAVNNELNNLQSLLEMLPESLSPGGRAAVISFHSLEDRRVKTAFAAMAKIGVAKVLTPKPITPTDEEIRLNPRSRSAKLRAIELAA